MKIILVNYRYFISGGPERYLFNIKGILEKRGHEVIPFSIKNERNTPNAYESYFMSPVGKDNEVYFKDFKKFNLAIIAKFFLRMFYSFEAKRKLGALIRDTQPDLIYVLHYQNKISPSIFDAAKAHGIPVINRISDFGSICANAHFYRPEQADICERCLTGSKFNAVRNKCVHHSFVYSAIKATSLKLQEVIHTTQKIQGFVVPSKFTIEKLKTHGFPPEKLHHIPTFFNFKTLSTNLEIRYDPFALYIGRIEPEKGLFTLIRSFVNTSFHLKVIGFSISGMEESLKKYLEGKNHHIEFLGKKSFEEIQHYLSRCLFTITPSECYDNLPNTLLESFAFRKCAVATDIGSLKELVVDQKTGLLFGLKDVEALRNKITYLFQNEEVARIWGQNAFDLLNLEFSAEKHYAHLINLFNTAISQAKRITPEAPQELPSSSGVIPDWESRNQNPVEK